MPDDHNDNNSQTPREPKIPGMPGGKKPTRTGWLYFILACALLGYAFFNMGSGFANSSNTVKLATSEMVSAIKQDRVEDLTYTVQDGSVAGHYWKTKKDKGDTSELKSFSSTYVGSDSLAELMAEHPDTKYIVNTNDPDFWGDLAMSVLPTIALIAIMFYFMRQMMGANNRNMQFGKTNAKTNEATRPKVKFEDVAGVDEAVEELEEIRDFLSDPDRYRKLGAKIPRGVLLVGPPGTGKTLLAKAVAGEAGVPFFSISGSDFVEMFVGVGASRVRDMFEQGKKNAPCIIFIDEIDAVGRQRGAGLGGGHDEREQTLNQLLVEMDGFESNEGVILIAATTAARSWFVASGQLDLAQDEAQYWDWAQDLSWGYYSKPPGIAALIWLSTALFGDGIVGVQAALRIAQRHLDAVGPARDTRLPAKRPELPSYLAQQVVEPRQVRFGVRQLAQRTFLALAVLEDARSLFDERAVAAGIGPQNRVQPPLPDDHVHLLPEPGVAQQLLDVEQTAGRAVDRVFGASVAEDGAGDGDFRVIDIERVIGIIDGQAHLCTA